MPTGRLSVRDNATHTDCHPIYSRSRRKTSCSTYPHEFVTVDGVVDAYGILGFVPFGQDKIPPVGPKCIS